LYRLRIGAFPDARWAVPADGGRWHAPAVCGGGVPHCGSRSCAPFLVRREIHKCPPSDLSLLGAACALALIGTLAAPARAAGGLAPDGDFEAAPFASYYTHGAGSFTWATDQHYSGTHSLKIVSTQPAGQLARWMTNTDAIRATPGTTYTASALYKTEAVAGQATLAASFWTANGVWTGTTVTSPTGLSGTNTWRLLDLQARAPAGSVSVRIELRLYGPGTIWIDDLSVTSQTEGPPVLFTPPSISGADYAGQTPVGDPGVWGGTQPITFYTGWLACSPYDCDGGYEGSTPGTYAYPHPTAGMAGYRLDFQVIAQNAYGSAVVGVQSSHIKPPPGSPPALTNAPEASGAARVGEALVTTPGTWIGADSIRYQWERCDVLPVYPWGADESTCTDIAGATGPSFVPTDAQLLSAVRVRVIASNGNGSTSAYAKFWPSAFYSWQLFTVIGPKANLVPNADVEAPPNGYYTHGNATFSWATDASRSGTHSLKIVSTQPTGQLARWMTLTQAIKVTPGSRYEANVSMKTRDVVQGAGLSVTFWDASGSYLGVADSPWQLSNVDPSGHLVNNDDWYSPQLTTTAPPHSAFARIELRLWGPGTLWADDLSVIQYG
jgi:hypothetical protein